MKTQTAEFGVTSIKAIVDQAQLGHITDEGALFMSHQVTQVLRSVIQKANKFRYHSRRRKLVTSDIDHALKVMNMKPVIGFSCIDHIPFRFSSAGANFLQNDKEIDLAEVIARLNIPKVPKSVALESHWLAIDGIQPAIPQNPPPLTKEEQRLECVDPLVYNEDFVGLAKTNVLKRRVETVQVKSLATHELSVEQQFYYKEITEACVGNQEQTRVHALNSLAHDPGLHQVLPRLCTFISEGVKVNVVHNNLALLIYLMRMVKALLDNQTLYLEKYLHELIPTVITCVVSKQICNRPEQDNHFALRDFASKLLANICRNYNTMTNSLQTRITRLLCKALDDPKLPLASVYGCISALCELGPEVQQTLLIRRIPAIKERLKATLDPSAGKESPEGRILNLIASKVQM